MSLEWFKVRAASEFGTELADQLSSQLVARARASERRAGAPVPDDLVRSCFERADGRLKTLQLNFLKRAKLANAFKWRLLESGLEQQLADRITQQLVVQLSLGAGAPASLRAPRTAPRSGRSESGALDAGATFKGLLARGNACAASADYEQALDCYLRAAELKPRSAEAHNNVGAMLFRLQRYVEAEPALRRALELRPDFHEALCTLATVRNWQGDFDESETLLRRALKLRPFDGDARVMLGTALSKQGRSRDAAAEFDAVLERTPAHVDALFGRAQLAVIEGRFSEAETGFRGVLGLPGITSGMRASALAGIASNRRMSSTDRDWLGHAQQLAGSRLEASAESVLRYAIGKYFDDVGEYRRAFEQFHRANEISRQMAPPYRPEARSEYVDAQLRLYTRQLLAAARQGATDSSLPVFVIGMPRSGTSLVEQIIASHPTARGAGELQFWLDVAHKHDAALRQGPLPLSTRRKLAGRYLQRLLRHVGEAARVIDKAPVNANFVGLIHAALPNARFLHLQRNPVDTCLSCYFQAFRLAQNYTMDLSDLEHYYRQHHRLMEHWRAVLPAGTLLDVPYEGLVADPAAWSRRIIDFIGLDWDERCLNFHQTERRVTTASAWQVRQKIYRSSVQRWRHYEKFIGPLKSLQDLHA